MAEKIIIGDAELWLGDCAEVLSLIEVKIDLLLTDPPYGLKEAAGKNKSRDNLAKATDYGNKAWDNAPINHALMFKIREMAKYQMIFGGNYYDLPPTRCWLVWDKDNGKTDFADCELVWTNLKKAVRLKKHRWNGMLQQDMKNKEKRVHPTQKPVPVMEWCLSHAPAQVETVLDPFMGAGTTGVACVNKGRKFIGIEKDPEYFEIACGRIRDAWEKQHSTDVKNENV